MQRDRHDERLCREKVRSGAQHQPRHHLGSLVTVPVFERMDEITREIVEDDGATRTVPCRRVGNGGRADRTFALIIGKGRAEPVAIGSLDELQP